MTETYPYLGILYGGIVFLLIGVVYAISLIMRYDSD